MKLMKFLPVFFLLLAPAFAAEVKPPTNPELRDELLAMAANDQELRSAARSGTIDRNKVVEADAVHTARMKEIVAEHGWPAEALVGEDGANAAWLLVQHADADPGFQERALTLMKPLLESGEINRRDYAYLWDRTHEPQRYGTQLRCVDGRLQPREIESPESVDVRRKDMGMLPLAEYLEEARALLGEAGDDVCADGG